MEQAQANQAQALAAQQSQQTASYAQQAKDMANQAAQAQAEAQQALQNITAAQQSSAAAEAAEATLANMLQGVAAGVEATEKQMAYDPTGMPNPDQATGGAGGGGFSLGSDGNTNDPVQRAIPFLASIAS